MPELHELDAHDQATALAAREVSSVELVQHHLDRIAALDDAVGAFITVTPDRALAGAGVADARRAAGAVPFFTGVPTAFKDLAPTAGVRTTLGSAAFADAVPDVSEHAVRLVEEAGFVSLGKTNTPEFGLTSFTDNDVRGPAATPWDLDRNAGGSSGGAAAAVAAGLVPLAPGSDGGGSLRIPASCCGVIGFKPSRGRVSPGPQGSDWSGLAGDGPLARTVRDAAALLDVMAVPQLGDGRRLPSPAEPFTSWVGRDPGRLRIAAWQTPYLPGITTDPAVAAVWEDACRLLASLGHDVEVVDNPFPPELEPHFDIVWSAGMAAAELPPGADELLRPMTRYWRERGARSSGPELAAAMQFLDLTTRGVMERLATYDAFLTPTLAMLPQPHAWFTDGDPEETLRRELLFTPFTAVYNMAGIPAASLPLGMSDGLPVGVMLGAHTGRDAELFSVLGQVEAAVGGFAQRHGVNGSSRTDSAAPSDGR